MATRRVTIALDREKVDQALALVGARSVSEVIDLALDRLIHVEQLRHDIAAYARQPQTYEEIALGDLAVEFDLGDEDVDYEALYSSRE